MSNIQTTPMPVKLDLVNVIWCYERKTTSVKILLLKDNGWTLPKTELLTEGDAPKAIIQLTEKLTGQKVARENVEQLYTLTHPERQIDGERTITLAYMTYLPEFPELSRKGMDFFTLESAAEDYYFKKDDERLTLPRTTNESKYHQYGLSEQALFLDDDLILQRACLQVKKSLHCRPEILKILGPVFTLREARSVYAPFLMLHLNQIDNSNFKKTHQKLFEDVGQAMQKSPGRPARLYRLRDN